ncbi:hypothetical protein [Moritella sp. 36]|uniref:hypothetical protein n=1 Tax=Moritella sp. 36 TaxID=2746233 RepID=UPI00210634C8|nr:hypothetical protein [Moritella sp. 36]
MFVVVIGRGNANVYVWYTDYFFSLFHVGANAILSAYIADSFCRWLGLDEGLKTGIIGIAAYVAPHLLTGVNALAKAVSKDPKHFLDIIMRNKS